MECCPHKLHSLATAWARHIFAVLAHFRLSPYPRPPSGGYCTQNLANLAASVLELGGFPTAVKRWPRRGISEAMCEPLEGGSGGGDTLPAHNPSSASCNAIRRVLSSSRRSAAARLRRTPSTAS